MIEARTKWPLFSAGENLKSTSYSLSFLQYCIQFWVLLDVMRKWWSLCYSILVIRSHCISIWAVVIRVTDICFVAKKNTRYRCNECGVAPIKSGEHNPENVSTIDRVITPLIYICLSANLNSPHVFLFLYRTRSNWSYFSLLCGIPSPGCRRPVNAIDCELFRMLFMEGN